MTRRRRTCTIADARARCASAVAFMDVAERLALEEFDHDVVRGPSHRAPARGALHRRAGADARAA